MSGSHQIPALIFLIAICFGAAWLGSVFTRPSIGTWYAQLTKPSWSPPNWIFAPVWTVLFGMMAVAAWLIWQHRGETDVTRALILFGVQLALNIAWSAIFFGLHR